MEVYLGKIYKPIVFGDAAPSVPSFIGSKVIFWWKSCVRSAGHISWRISFKFCTDVHHSQIYTPIVFGDAAPNVPSFIGSKVILVHILVCALTAALLDRFLSNFVLKCILVNSTRLLLLVMLPPVFRSFIGSKVIFWWKSCVRSAGHISWRISFKFCTDVHHSQIYTPLVFGDAAPCVPSFIGSKVIFWFTFFCAL